MEECLGCVHTLNNITTKKDVGGSVAVQFGGCDGETSNCLPPDEGIDLVRVRMGEEGIERTFGGGA